MTAELRPVAHERFVSYAPGGWADPSLVLSDDITEAAAGLWRSAVEESPSGAVPDKVVVDHVCLHWLATTHCRPDETEMISESP